MSSAAYTAEALTSELEVSEGVQRGFVASVAVSPSDRSVAAARLPLSQLVYSIGTLGESTYHPAVGLPGGLSQDNTVAAGEADPAYSSSAALAYSSSFGSFDSFAFGGASTASCLGYLLE